MSVNKIDIFNDYSNRNLDNLNIYRTCDDKESCIYYMFKNSERIYKELDPYNNIPKQLENDKLENLFNSNNIVKTNLLNDEYINTLKTELDITNTNLIINTILMHLRPYIFSNNTNITQAIIDTVKNSVVNTLRFDKLYMNDIDSQLSFLMRNSTIEHIKSEIMSELNNSTIEIKTDYIKSMIRHEVNNYRSRYDSSKENNKLKPDEISGIYYFGMAKFKTRDIFNIIRDTVSKISSTLKIEKNMITNNTKLDKWDTILGNNNPHGMRQYTTIKLNHKKPAGMLFNMNY